MTVPLTPVTPNPATMPANNPAMTQAVQETSKVLSAAQGFLGEMAKHGQFVKAIESEIRSSQVRVGEVTKAFASQNVNLSGEFNQVLTEVNKLSAMDPAKINPADLMRVQINFQAAAMHMEVVFKVIEMGTSGVKTMLQTQM